VCDDAQDGDSCLMSAVQLDNLYTVRQLCEVGGKELMMLQNKVWMFILYSYLKSVFNISQMRDVMLSD
jgi:hypothetical protein